MKQVEADPWATIDERYKPGDARAGQGAQPHRLRRLRGAGARAWTACCTSRTCPGPATSGTRRSCSRRASRWRRRSSTWTGRTSGSRSGSSRSSPIRGSSVAQRYPMGSRVTGKVVRLTDFGAFVELEPGVDGLLHISQMSSRPIATPADIVNVGDELTLMVIRVDPNERRIGLSLKELAAVIEEPAQTDAARPGAQGPQASRRRRLRRRGVGPGGLTRPGRPHRPGGGGRSPRAVRRHGLADPDRERRRPARRRQGGRRGGRGRHRGGDRGHHRRRRPVSPRARRAPRQPRGARRWCSGSTARAGWSRPPRRSSPPSQRRARRPGKPVVASLRRGGRLRRLLRRGRRRPHLRQPRHAHRLDRRRHAARQRRGPAQEGRRRLRGGQGGRLQGRRQLRAGHDARRSARFSRRCSTTSTPSSSPRSPRAAGSTEGRCSRFADGRIYSGQQAHGAQDGGRAGRASRTPSRRRRKLAGICRPSPSSLYPQATLLLARSAAQPSWGLGPVSRMLPALPTLRTPLYLMQ